MLRQLAERGLPAWNAELGKAALTHLLDAAELALIAQLARYPDIVASAAELMEPHQVAQYLRELAAAFHGFYNTQPMLVDDAGQRNARIALAVATQQVLRNGLDLLGVSAPEKM